MFSLVCAWTNVWANNHNTGDLRCHGDHYDCNGITESAAANVTPWLQSWSIKGRRVYESQSFQNIFTENNSVWQISIFFILWRDSTNIPITGNGNNVLNDSCSSLSHGMSHNNFSLIYTYKSYWVICDKFYVIISLIKDVCFIIITHGFRVMAINILCCNTLKSLPLYLKDPDYHPTSLIITQQSQ